MLLKLFNLIRIPVEATDRQLGVKQVGKQVAYHKWLAASSVLARPGASQTKNSTDYIFLLPKFCEEVYKKMKDTRD